MLLTYEKEFNSYLKSFYELSGDPKKLEEYSRKETISELASDLFQHNISYITHRFRFNGSYYVWSQILKKGIDYFLHGNESE